MLLNSEEADEPEEPTVLSLGRRKAKEGEKDREREGEILKGRGREREGERITKNLCCVIHCQRFTGGTFYHLTSHRIWVKINKFSQLIDHNKIMKTVNRCAVAESPF